MIPALLVIAAALPASATIALAALRLPSDRAARLSLWAVAGAVLASVVTAWEVTNGGPVSAVLTAGDGNVVFGLVATRASILLALLSAGVGLVVQSFSARALRGERDAWRFFALTSLVTAATITTALAATLTLLCAGWITTSSALAALVSHRRSWPAAQRAARRTRRSLLIGDVALLAATAIAVATAGDPDLRSPAGAARTLSARSVAGTEVLQIVAVLLAVAAIARSALVPLHRWLPATVAAPTPVSALLHAGVVNGAGVLFLRLGHIFGGSPVATHLLFATGTVTAVYGTAVMLVRTDVKGNLALSTVGQMGFMAVQLSTGALAAAFVHLLGHGMYKAALFLGSGGAITQHLRNRNRPALTPVPFAMRLASSLAVPPLALWTAFWMSEPHLPRSAVILVVVFAWATAGLALDGWLRAAPFASTPALVTGWLGTWLGVSAYVSALGAIEHLVAPALPEALPAAVGWVTLAAALAALFVGTAILVLLPGPGPDRLRRRLYAFLLTSAATPLPRRRRRAEGPDRGVSRWASSGASRVDTTRPHAEKRQSLAEHHAELLADVVRAAEIVAPCWPLTSFVAVNPLNGLVHLPFEKATSVARRWLGARTHPSLAELRWSYEQGRVTDAELRFAIIEAAPEVASLPVVEVAGRSVDPAEIVRLDLLNGPDYEEQVRPRQLDAADELVAVWCAAYVDEAGVPWPMPDRQLGFFRSWRRLAGYDTRLQRLAARSCRSWLAELPDSAPAALAAALDELGVRDDERVEVLRGLLSRLPGWAGYARWRSEWAPASHKGPPLHLVDLLAVQATVTALTGSPLEPRRIDAGEPSAQLLDDRVAAVVRALGASPCDNALAEQVRGVLQLIPLSLRRTIALEAHERRQHDQLLALLGDRSPSQVSAPDVQAVFCIDVRSEGLRRHLEALGPYETLGFAGFFGVPVSWRPLGSPVSQPRCPVLVTPRHEVMELPTDPGVATRFLATQRAAAAGHKAFHRAKGSLAAPFVLAETAGYVLGPLAAFRTLAPGLVSRISEWASRRTSRLPTMPAVRAEDHPCSGLALEERVLFAEAIVRTVCLTRFAPLVVLCGHGSVSVNNPHATSYDCGACGGAPGGPSARVAAAILNDPDVRAALAERGITIPPRTLFVAAQHDTCADTVTVLDRPAVPASHEALVAAFERDVEQAGRRRAQERARRLPGDPTRVRIRGRDWAEVRPEWGLAGNTAFVIGPRSITAQLNLGERVFLHSYDANTDEEGTALETILTAPLVVAQWISAQYYFSAVDPEVFGAGDKLLQNPVGGIGVILGEAGDLRVGLPQQALAVDNHRMHEPLRLLAVVQAPLARTEAIIRRNDVLRQLLGGRWMAMVCRADDGEPWWQRRPDGTWVPWEPADAVVEPSITSLEAR